MVGGSNPFAEYSELHRCDGGLHTRGTNAPGARTSWEQSCTTPEASHKLHCKLDQPPWQQVQ
eukprot:404262-Amphidinium_carterae.2